MGRWKSSRYRSKNRCFTSKGIAYQLPEIEAGYILFYQRSVFL